MNFDTARNQMLAQQIRTWNVLDDRVLEVLRKTPRELFVPEQDRDLAFADVEIPLAHGQCMMNPKVEGRLLQELAIEPLDNVLEVGTGSGYVAACLAQLAGEVKTIEIFEDLSESAASRLKDLRLGNVRCEVADALALTTQDRYDAIAITGSIPELSEHFIRMLKPHGRLFVVVGRPPAMEAKLITMHSDGSWTAISLFETVLTPLVNASTAEPFVL
jgi:protein-L-isoaspartate(D-aspartate) O-methyltransferase